MGRKLRQIDLQSWPEFAGAFTDIRKSVYGPSLRSPSGSNEILFRGMPSATLELKSSMERSVLAKDGVMAIHEYLEKVAEIQPQITALSSQGWPTVIPSHAFDFYGKEGRWYKHYPYMTYLRHHGYPSPLLDWSLSPYVAAYFAFGDDLSRDASSRVAVFAYCEYPHGGKTWDPNLPHVRGLGSIVETHHRHYRQQSRYTVCVRKKPDEDEYKYRWEYVPYADILNSDDDTQDVFWKITIPSSVVADALSDLDMYNINAYSLFATDESLLNALHVRQAIRQLDIRRAVAKASSSV